MAVYLLHYERPIGGPGRSGAQHYIGHCEPWQIPTRMHAHKTGNAGVKITTAFAKAKIPFRVSRMWWDGGLSLERYLKKMGHFDRLCPICHNLRMMAITADLTALANDGNSQAARRLERRISTNGGVARPGSQTSNGGWSQAGLPLESSTTSGGPDPTAPLTTGGSATPAPVPPISPSGPSVGTKPVSRSR